MDGLRTICLLLLASLMMTCSEVVDLEIASEAGLIIVDGHINNGTEGNQVVITQTQIDGVVPQPVEGLEVIIYDDAGNSERLIEDTPGVYKLQANQVSREPGRSIWVQFEFSGKTYQSTPQTMQRIIANDELRWEVSIERGVTPEGGEFEEEVVRVFANTTFDELPEEFYLRWKVEEVYTILEAYLPPQNFITRQFQCFVWNDLSEQEIFLLNGLKIRNFELNNRELVTRRVDRSFSNKHYFNLIQMALTKESHDYWEKVNSVTTLTGSIFDTPPGAIPGNVKSTDPNEVVLGFFDVVQIDTARTFLTNDDILYFFDDPCYVTGAARFYQLISVPFDCRQCLVDRGIMPQECVDCIKVNNSSFERPSYF